MATKVLLAKTYPTTCSMNENSLSRLAGGPVAKIKTNCTILHLDDCCIVL